MLISLNDIPFLKNVPKRALRALEKKAVRFSLPGGMNLFDEGDPADALYIVISGALGYFRSGKLGTREFVNQIRAGEPIGEMEVLADQRMRYASYALRDSELIKIPRMSMMQLIRREPALMQKLARLIIIRLRQEGRKRPEGSPRLFTLISTSPTIDINMRAHLLAQELEKQGYKTAIAGENTGPMNASDFDRLRAENNFVFLTAMIGDSTWYKLAMRQADRIWVFARADARPSIPLWSGRPSPARQLQLIDLIYLNSDGQRSAASPQDWMKASTAMRLFHWRDLEESDSARLARIICGRSVGVVLSGGGARAFAHIGVIRALREAHCPIDFIGGASMGAIIAACVAVGWDDDEIERRIKNAFVRSNPLGDYTLPVFGLVRGKRMEKRLRNHFKETYVEETRIPFFALSSDLTHGHSVIHQTGKIRDVLRASASLPGILPPVLDKGRVLCDGGILNNCPADIMQDWHRGFTIGSDVTPSDNLSIQDHDLRYAPVKWLAKNSRDTTFPIMEILMRAATISNRSRNSAQTANLFINPNLPDISLQDWKAYDQTVAAGYDAMKDTLKTIRGPFAGFLRSQT